MEENIMEAQRAHFLTPVAQRTAGLGPWVEIPRTVLAKGRRKSLSHEGNGKSIDFLATVCRKHNKFKTGVREFNTQKDEEQMEKTRNNEIRNTIHLERNLRKELFEGIKKYEIYLTDENEIVENRKALNTTVYLCENKPKNKSKRLFSSEKSAPSGNESETNKEEESRESSKVSKNLQRILKMREKLRVKNNTLSKSIKQKYSLSVPEASHQEQKEERLLKSISNEVGKNEGEKTLFKSYHSFLGNVKGVRTPSIKTPRPLISLSQPLQNIQGNTPYLNLMCAKKTKFFSRF